MPTPVIAIYDVGKTNKKVFLLNEDYDIVYEKSSPFPEIQDEDGFTCDDVDALKEWIQGSFRELLQLKEFEIIAANFTGFGASFVHIDEAGKPVTPLYSYLKPYPEALKKKFYDTYDGEITFSMHTASPVLGSLNSGMQVYRLKEEKKDVFENIRYSLHLPQYLSYLLTGKAYSDLTSIGCHTNLWNFPQHSYHEWVYRESIIDKMAPLYPSDKVIEVNIDGKTIKTGGGLHDSSSALIPYLMSFREPFILISTGTWSISLNPFNAEPLTVEELQHDCLCYMTFKGAPVKASRLFAGYEHEQQVKLLAEHFNTHADYYKTIKYDSTIIEKLPSFPAASGDEKDAITVFPNRKLSDYPDYETAYHQLIVDIIEKQLFSTSLVLKGTEAKRIFVDGGFSKNPIYMELLARAFPDIEVYAASVAQATSLGAALAIHPHWNRKSIPSNLIELNYYHIPNE